MRKAVDFNSLTRLALQEVLEEKPGRLKKKFCPAGSGITGPAWLRKASC